jgi:23S rRNA (adenine2030-N6)-methyltransferase
MLSYQHGFHAGNLADVQKHALMAVMIDYLTRKDKPLSYIETHAGRGLYDLQGSQAQKTGEAAAGILKVDKWFKPDHPYARARKTVADAHGKNMYPG